MTAEVANLAVDGTLSHEAPILAQIAPRTATLLRLKTAAPAADNLDGAASARADDE